MLVRGPRFFKQLALSTAIPNRLLRKQAPKRNFIEFIAGWAAKEFLSEDYKEGYKKGLKVGLEKGKLLGRKKEKRTAHKEKAISATNSPLLKQETQNRPLPTNNLNLRKPR